MTDRTLNLIIKKYGSKNKISVAAMRKYKREKKAREMEAIMFHLMQMNIL